MNDDDEASELSNSLAADQVYAGPHKAQADAERTIADGDSTDTERAEALATLGRSAYYDNRISEAIGYLESARGLDIDDALRSEISLILAPTLSKQGRSDEALELLDLASAGPLRDIEAKALNQRGAILVELGRIPDALESFGRAADLHRELGDAGGEGRSLLNMGAAASEMGDSSRAEALYERAWQLNQKSGQRVMCAMIEGNLGYVFSRKGDFSSALEWYRRGRNSFAELGDIELLVAVLETDHATTLLDLGLNNEAYEAAEFARSSSLAGSNRMLEVQAMLLLGEAQLRLGHFAAAETTLTSANDLATELGVLPFQLRSEYLRQRLHSAEGNLSVDPVRTIEVAKGLADAAWNREALRTLVFGAHAALDAGDAPATTELLAAVEAIDLDGVDSIDRAHATALRAFHDADDDAFAKAMQAGELEIDRQRLLLSSAELQTRLGHRVRDLRELAIRRPVESNDALTIFVMHDRIRTTRGLQRRSIRRVSELRSQLRDVRVGLQEAQLKGGSTDELKGRAAALEQQILTSSLDNLDETELGPLVPLLSQPTALNLVSFFGHRGRMFALTSVDELSLHDLGPADIVRQSVRTQRSAIRRMAAGDDRARQRAEVASQQLGELIIEPLDLPDHAQLAIVADAGLAGVSWAGISHMRHREFFLAPSVRSVIAQASPIRVESVGLIDGGGLEFAAAELDSIATAWAGMNPQVAEAASIDDARSIFDSTDLVHVAAHGTFRADNPFFSALKFRDAEMTLVELENQANLPHLMTLASCDSGAASNVGVELVGTTEVLLSLGVEAVFASALIVDDAAASRIAIDIHVELASGSAPVQAMQLAREQAIDRGAVEDLAAAAAFSLHGGASSLLSLEISRI